MARHFESLGEMALFLAAKPVEVAIELEHGLDRVLALIENRAKAQFGEYQPAVGPFPRWPELADATKADRLAQGYTENDPLLRSGEQRDSLEHARKGLEGVVGSTDEKMLWSELGTSREPARPVLGPAAFLSKAAIQKLVGAAAVAGLIGHSAAAELGAFTETLEKGTGYDFETSD